MGAIPHQESAESCSLLSHLSYQKPSYLLAREAAGQHCASVSSMGGRSRAREVATHAVGRTGAIGAPDSFELLKSLHDVILAFSQRSRHDALVELALTRANVSHLRSLVQHPFDASSLERSGCRGFGRHRPWSCLARALLRWTPLACTHQPTTTHRCGTSEPEGSDVTAPSGRGRRPCYIYDITFDPSGDRYRFHTSNGCCE